MERASLELGSMRVKIDPKELPEEGAGRVILLDNGKEIALFCKGGTFYAIDNLCPHEGGPLGDGELDGAIVTCPWHGWQFDVTTGKNMNLWDEGVKRYLVEVINNEVFVIIA